MTVRGNIRDMSLTGLISVNCNEGNRARLHVQHEQEDAYIYFDQGEIVHLVLGEREGEEVMREILAWDEGIFELDMQVSPPRQSVHVPWHSLVLAGMHTLDEKDMVDDAPDQLAALEAAIADETLAVEKSAQETTHFIQEVNPMAELRDLLKEMAADIPGFQAAAVAGMDGLAIAEYRAAPDFNLEMATAQFALVMKLVDRTMGRLKGGDVEDNLVTTDDVYILSRLLGEGSSYYLVVSVERDLASLGNVRLMTRNFAPELWDAIPRR